MDNGSCHAYGEQTGTESGGTMDGSTTTDPLGPDSLTWKYFGDLRTGMLGV